MFNLCYEYFVLYVLQTCVMYHVVGIKYFVLRICFIYWVLYSVHAIWYVRL